MVVRNKVGVRNAASAQGAHQSQPVQAGQHAIDDQQIPFLGRSPEQARAAIGSDLKVVSLVLQSRDNILGRLGVVLDQQDVHSTALTRAHAKAELGLASTCRFRRLRTASDKLASAKLPAMPTRICMRLRPLLPAAVFLSTSRLCHGR